MQLPVNIQTQLQHPPSCRLSFTEKHATQKKSTAKGTVRELHVKPGTALTSAPQSIAATQAGSAVTNACCVSELPLQLMTVLAAALHVL